MEHDLCGGNTLSGVVMFNDSLLRCLTRPMAGEASDD
jgi:hypothetical protein